MSSNRKRLFLIEGVLQMLIGLGAVMAGFRLIEDPSGGGLMMTTELLRNSPFITFLIPGFILFVLFGFGNISASLLSLYRNRFAGRIGILLGFLLLIWMVLQVYWIGFIYWLQLLYFVLGLFELTLGYLIDRTTKRINNNQQLYF